MSLLAEVAHLILWGSSRVMFTFHKGRPARTLVA